MRQLAVSFALVLVAVPTLAEDRTERSTPQPPAPVTAPPPSNAAKKWHHFLDETFSPLTLVAGAANGAVSQATNSDPRYGVGGGALAERFGASTVDTVTQNFFGDFVMAWALHEDTRYRRKGPAYGGFWKRTEYALTRALITRTDNGARTFNWSNVAGSALSAGLSNLYYPPASCNGRAIAINFVTNISGAGLGNMLPEFWPDVRRLFRRH